MPELRFAVDRCARVLLASSVCVCFATESISAAMPPFEFYRVSLNVDGRTLFSDYQVVQANPNREVVGSAGWGISSATRLAWLWTNGVTVPLGLRTAEHVDVDGTFNSGVAGISDAGHVAGTSRRFLPNSGVSAWIYSGGTNGTYERIGYFAGDFASGSLAVSSVFSVFRAGVVTGTSTKYGTNGANRGQVAWTFDPVGRQTARLGLSGSAYVSSLGDEYHELSVSSPAGFVAGFSRSYSGSSGAGEHAFVSGSSGTYRLGFTDSAHTLSVTGTQSSVPLLMSESGLVAGFSRRYSSTGSAGQSAWVTNGAGTSSITRVGLTDSEHAAFGNQSSTPRFIGTSGVVAGTSVRYRNFQETGQSAWVFWNGTTHRTGLFSTPYTDVSGFQTSDVIEMNNSGVAIGTSRRFTGSPGVVLNAWVFQNGTTSMLGLSDVEHGSGNLNSIPSFLNESGAVTGNTTRSTSFGGGTTSWYFQNGTISRIGLSGSVFLRSDGYRESEVLGLTETGLAFGRTAKFANSAFDGSVGWMFDPVANSTIALAPSTLPLGFRSTPMFVSSDGEVLGSYSLGVAGSESVFFWSANQGFIDLLSPTVGNASSSGWQKLVQLVSNSIPGIKLDSVVAGYGETGTNRSLWIAIPPPATVSGVSGGIVICFRRPRRARR